MTELQGIPRYRLLRPFYAEDDTLYPEGMELAYTGQPNTDMEPLNEPARQAMIPVIQGTQKKPLADQVHDAHAALHERDRTAATPEVVFPKQDKTVPLMPNQVLPGQRPRGRPKKVIDAKPPAPDVAPKPVMGTVITTGRDGAVDTGGGLNR